MDYQLESLYAISVFIDSVTFCILSNSCKMKSMANVEIFMLTQLKHLKACMIQKSLAV